MIVTKTNQPTDLIRHVEESVTSREVPPFQPGDTVKVHVRVIEGEKERMVEDAEKFADADKKRREDADKLNEADSICYQA